MIAPERLETARLVLRRPRASDAAAVSAYASDPDVTRYMSWPTHRSPADATAFLEQCERWWQTGEEFGWAITVRPDDALVGTIGCRVRGHAAAIGYVLARPFWRRGYVPEAAAAVVRWASDLDGVYRVWAFCDTANPASARVLEKAGMTREGILRRWSVHPNVSAEPRDCFVYSRVRGDR
jgi:[ribosomal protein S5]-alanine N-acetyltransferase